MRIRIPSFLRIAGIYFGIAIAGVLVISLIGWAAGWKSSVEFSNAYFVAGAIIIGFGAISVLGGFGLRGDKRVLYPRSAGVLNLDEQINRLVDDSSKSERALIICFIVGTILIAAAVLAGNLR
jgi:hypothetical protein